MRLPIVVSRYKAIDRGQSRGQQTLRHSHVDFAILFSNSTLLLPDILAPLIATAPSSTLPLLAGPVFALIIANGERREKNKTTFLLRRSCNVGTVSLSSVILLNVRSTVDSLRLGISCSSTSVAMPSSLSIIVNY